MTRWMCQASISKQSLCEAVKALGVQLVAAFGVNEAFLTVAVYDDLFASLLAGGSMELGEEVTSGESSTCTKQCWQ